MSKVVRERKKKQLRRSQDRSSIVLEPMLLNKYVLNKTKSVLTPLTEFYFILESNILVTIYIDVMFRQKCLDLFAVVLLRQNFVL